MNFLIYGSGAIGGYVGGSLALAGHAVTFIARPAQAEAINARGLTIRNNHESRVTSHVSAVISPAEAFSGNDKYDCIIFALKSFDTDNAIADLRAARGQAQGLPLPPIVCLQNGVDNEPKLVAAFGTGNVIAGTVLTAVGVPAPGEIAIEKSRGIGLFGGHPLSIALASAFESAGIVTRLYSNPYAMKWTKLLTNLMANATSAICDMTTEAVFDHPGLYRIEIGALREALAVMDAKKIPVVPLPRTPTVALSFVLRHLPPRWYQPIFRRAIAGGRGEKAPSLHMDLSAGKRRSEVSYLNGAVAHHAAQVGLSAPINRALTKTLEKIVEGKVAWEEYRGRPERLVKEVRRQTTDE